jgi:hypothetical protein
MRASLAIKENVSDPVSSIDQRTQRKHARYKQKEDKAAYNNHESTQLGLLSRGFDLKYTVQVV